MALKDAKLMMIVEMKMGLCVAKVVFKENVGRMENLFVMMAVVSMMLAIVDVNQHVISVQNLARQ
jgi:hypothetical protein